MLAKLACPMDCTEACLPARTVGADTPHDHITKDDTHTHTLPNSGLLLYT
jgi:hypothetical protein